MGVIATPDAKVNDFAIRSFRNVGDTDYIAARMSWRASLSLPFLWQSQQCLEKYLKCILLLNRVTATKATHHLTGLLELAEKSLSFPLNIETETRHFLGRLDRVARFRYLEVSHYVYYKDLIKLDSSVWDLRRYCQVLDPSVGPSYKNKNRILELTRQELSNVARENRMRFRPFNGRLEDILDNKKSSSRAALVWNNLCYGTKYRRSILIKDKFSAENSPLTLDPFLLDEITKYVFLPKEVKEAYRQAQIEEAKKKKS